MTTWNKLRAVVFDLDDTLYAERDYFGLVFQMVCRAHALPVTAFQPVLDDFSRVRRHEKDIFRYALRTAGLPSDELHEALFRAYTGVDARLELSDGAADWLAFLEENGVCAAVLTNGPPDAQRRKWACLGLEGSDVSFFAARDLGGDKPSPTTFERLREALNVQYGELFFVGDKYDVDLAYPLGQGSPGILVGSALAPATTAPTLRAAYQRFLAWYAPGPSGGSQGSGGT